MGKSLHVRKDVCFYIWSALACIGMVIICMAARPSENPADLVRIIADPVVYMIGFFAGDLFFKRSSHSVTNE
jgi:hypothetical protein